MILTYEKPILTVIGSVRGLTDSFKCTPGPDSEVDTDTPAAELVTKSPATNTDGISRRPSLAAA